MGRPALENPKVQKDLAGFSQACAIPSMRVARIDPVVVLNRE